MVHLSPLLPLAIATLFAFTSAHTPATVSTVSNSAAGPPPKCKCPAKRKAWQALTHRERTAYINAELCLQRLPSKAKLPAALSRFDDLTKAHQIPALTVHGTGYFFPFHRAFLHAHETLLRTECDYTGYQPYWAEEIDIGNISNSELLRPEYFGGGGKKENGWCVEDGAFKDRRLTIGPGVENKERCLGRNLQDNPTWGAGRGWTRHCNGFGGFVEFMVCMQTSGPHVAFHMAVGVTLNDPVASPSDPLFFLHHAWVDKLWYDWQRASPSTRLTAIGGRKNGSIPGIGGGPIPGFGPFGGLPFVEAFPPLGVPPLFPNPDDWQWAKLFEGFNNTWAPPVGDDPVGEADPVALGDVMEMFGTVEDVRVGDVMDTKGGYLCYKYVDYKEKTPKGKGN